MYKSIFLLVLAFCLFSCEKNKTTTFEYRVEGTGECAIAYSTLENPVVRDTINLPWSYTIELPEGQCHNFQLFAYYVYFDKDWGRPVVHTQPWIVMLYDDQVVGSADAFGMCLDTDCETFDEFGNCMEFEDCDYQEKVLVISEEICR